MYAHGEACRPDEDRADTGAYCPFGSVIREPYDGIIGDAPTRAIPFGRLYVVSDSLRRHAYTVMVEAVMSTGQSGAKPAGLSQLNLNAAGIDVGATSHFVAVPANHVEQPVREFAAFTADLCNSVITACCWVITACCWVITACCWATTASKASRLAVVRSRPVSMLQI